jgi:hypothetical protein
VRFFLQNGHNYAWKAKFVSNIDKFVLKFVFQFALRRLCTYFALQYLQ